jgi:hypothetical protein
LFPCLLPFYLILNQPLFNPNIINSIAINIKTTIEIITIRLTCDNGFADSASGDSDQYLYSI